MPERKLNIPHGLDLSSLLFESPDEPLPSLAAFDRLYQEGDIHRLEALAQWADSQQTINVIRKHHGDAGMNRVLKGIAKGCSEHKVPMTPRIKSIASFYGMQVY